MQFVTKRYDKIRKKVGKNLLSYVTHSKNLHKHFYSNIIDCVLKDVCVDTEKRANYILHTEGKQLT